MPKTTLKITILVILLLLLGLGGYFAYSLNLFKKLAPIKTYNNYGGDIKNDPDRATLVALGTDVAEFDYIAKWDSAKTVFWSNVKGVSKTSSTITIVFQGPFDMPFDGVEKSVDVSGCTTQNTYFTSSARAEMPKEVKSNVSLFDQIKVGDDFAALCLNEECTAAGRMCRVHRQFKPNPRTDNDPLAPTP